MSAKDEGLDQETLKLIEVMLDKNEERRFLDSPSLSSYARDLILLSNEFENAGEKELEQRCHAALGRVVEAQSPFMTSEGLQQYQHELLEALVGLPLEGAHVDAVEAQNRLTTEPDQDAEPAEEDDPDSGEIAIGSITELADGKAAEIGKIYKGQRVVIEPTAPEEEPQVNKIAAEAAEAVSMFEQAGEPGMAEAFSHAALLRAQDGLDDIVNAIFGSPGGGGGVHNVETQDLTRLQVQLVNLLSAVTKEVAGRANPRTDSELAESETDNDGEDGEEPPGGEGQRFGTRPNIAPRPVGSQVLRTPPGEEGDAVDKAHAEMAAKEPQGDAALSNALGRVADMLKGRDEA